MPNITRKKKTYFKQIRSTFVARSDKLFGRQLRRQVTHYHALTRVAVRWGGGVVVRCTLLPHSLSPSPSSVSLPPFPLAFLSSPLPLSFLLRLRALRYACCFKNMSIYAASRLIEALRFALVFKKSTSVCRFAAYMGTSLRSCVQESACYLWGF